MAVVRHGYDVAVSCHAWRILYTTNTDKDVGGSCHPAVQRVYPIGLGTSGVIRLGAPRAQRWAGVGKRHHDRFIDRGDGILALIRPVDRVPKAMLLNRAVPVLQQLLTAYNASLPRHSQPQRQLRVRVVVHAGEVHYDANGCYGEALARARRGQALRGLGPDP